MILREALDATHPGHTIDVDAVLQWLLERDVIVAVDYQRRWRREAAARRSARLEEARDRVAAAPVYTGTAVASCQASVSEQRGAPRRCGRTGRLWLRQDWHGRAMVVCLNHLRAHHTGPYTGWGGDPNPPRETIEPDLAALVAP